VCVCVCVCVCVYMCARVCGGGYIYTHIYAIQLSPPVNMVPLQPYIYHYTFGVEYTTDGIPVVGPTKEEQLTTPQRKNVITTPSLSSL